MAASAALKGRQHGTRRVPGRGLRAVLHPSQPHSSGLFALSGAGPTHAKSEPPPDAPFARPT
jgi:hypothetical protein